MASPNESEEIKRKRSDSIETGDDGTTTAPSRRRITLTRESKLDSKIEQTSSESRDRWRSHRMMEDYVNVVGDLIYPSTLYGSFGYDTKKARYPLCRINTLGYLTNNPIRRGSTLESWNPFEIATFEASLSLHGKKFNLVQKNVRTKSVKEVIAFYYEWKKTNHYQQWKTNYILQDREQANIPLH